MIKVVGLGPGSKEALTLGTLDILKDSEHIYLRTLKHPVVSFLEELRISFETYDEEYEKADSFDDVYSAIAEDLIKKHERYGEIVYAVPGHPLVAEKSVSILLEICKNKNIPCDIVPAVSFIDALIESLHIDPIHGIKIIDAFDINNQILDKRCGIVITQVYNKLIASEVKLKLLENFRDDLEIYFVRAAGIKGMECIKKIPIYEIDRQDDIDYLTSLYIPGDRNGRKDFYDLLNIMQVLRSENGCPWDREQTHETLKKYLVEESYEAIEAIDEDDDDMLIEELGDVLLQVIFHAEIGREDGYFNIDDVIAGICKKMIDRHPHVFGSEKIETSCEVLDKWDKIKMKEQKLSSHTDELRHVARALPSLIRAEKIQKKAAKVGFDWDEVECAMDKVLEEFDEVKDVYKGKNRARILEEVGDLLFAVVNVSRFLDVDPEEALNHTTDKFINRFEFIEKSAASMGKIMEDMTLNEMDQLWEKSKIK